MGTFNTFLLRSEKKRNCIRFTCVLLVHFKNSDPFCRFFLLLFAANFSLRFNLIVFASKRNEGKSFFFASNISFCFKKHFFALYSTLLHLPFLRFHCVRGCWDQTAALAVRSSNHSARSPPQNLRIAYQENDEGRFYICSSADVLMCLNMKLYQRINVILYRLIVHKCTGVSMYICIGNQSFFNRQRM